MKTVDTNWVIQPFWDMAEEDILGKLRSFPGLQLRHDLEKFQVVGDINLDSPYLWTNPEKNTKSCLIWWDILFQCFGIIPQVCQFKCWKIVIKPRNVYETFEVYHLLKSLGLHGKAGYDGREYTYGYWAAFVYNDTVEEAKVRWSILRQALDERFGKDIPCILKRGCTEFELTKPSNQWNLLPGQPEFEQKVLSYIDIDLPLVPQTDWMERKGFRKWVKQAHMIGDDTYKHIKLPDGHGIHMPAPPVTYHKEEWLNEGSLQEWRDIQQHVHRSCRQHGDGISECR